MKSTPYSKLPKTCKNHWKSTGEPRISWQQGLVAIKGYDAKIKKYSKLNYDGHIIPLAFDSAGAIAPKSAAFINKLYAR